MTNKEKKPKIVHAFLPKNEPFKTTLTAGKHELTADEAEEVEGGKNQGADPYDYLLMSLGSCTLMTVKMYARRKGWKVDNLFLELKHNKEHNKDCENCDDERSKIDVIQKELIVDGDLDDEQMNRLLEISKKCPVHRTLLSTTKIESKISKK